MMNIKTTLAAALLALVPGFATAMGCSDGHERAMSCAEGTQYDPESGTCVPVASS